MNLGKKVKIFGKQIPAVLIALLAIAGLASAGLLSYYGIIKGTATLEQSVFLDGKNVKNGSLEITYSYTGAAGDTVVDGPHKLVNNANVPAKISFKTTCCNSTTGQCGYGTRQACEGITTTVTSTITESSSYADYVNDSQRLVALKVSGLTLNDLLTKDLEYTVDVVSNPKFAPNINIFITDGTNYRVIHAWGKDWLASGLQTVKFSELVNRTKGYGASIRNSLLPPDISTPGPNADSDGYYRDVDKLKSDFGNWHVYFVEVRAQAGAAGGQVIRPVTFKAAGVTIDVPDSDSITEITLQPGELLNFYIKNSFAINLIPDTYTITTSVVPVTG
jgi:hypothetical protein